jgi:Pyruvate/2-oxoacid:ferredoxin oxidoreductase delta subunit
VKRYKKILIFYFTGTGNSGKVAEWIAQVASSMNIEAVCMNIANANVIDTPEVGALVVFISPVHGFNYPPVMMRFITQFPKGKNDVALINTRAGMLIGKWITPGLSGITFYLSSAILKTKGYSIKSMFPVDLPSNWISLHPGLNKPAVKYLHLKNKEKVTRFASQLLSGESNFKGLYDIVQDIVISPVAVLYYCVGRFFFAKTYYASRDCTKCGLCIEQCPVKAIKWVDGRPFWTLTCESCMKCMSDCPTKAIETGHGAIAVLVGLYLTVLSGLFYHFVKVPVFIAENFILRILMESVLFLALLAIWYRIIHLLLRFKFFERLMVYTSLTKYKFWGKRYKALKDKEFQDLTK